MDKIPYALAISSLMYAMVCSRPDIAHAVGVVNRYMSNPGKQHWEAVKWIMRYLKGSSETCLSFTASGLTLEGFVDVDLAGDVVSRKSTTGYVHSRRHCCFLEFYLAKDRHSFNNRSWICCSLRIYKRDRMVGKFPERIGQDKWKGYFV